jgi:anti-sigma28 factor (negative regulator of flagellin synthesis)
MNEIENLNTDRPASSDTFPVSAGVQLTKLSSVLNGLEHGASAMRQHVSRAMAALKSGTYKVDASAVSRLIISESLGSDSRPAEQG